LPFASFAPLAFDQRLSQDQNSYRRPTRNCRGAASRCPPRTPDTPAAPKSGLGTPNWISEKVSYSRTVCVLKTLTTSPTKVSARPPPAFSLYDAPALTGFVHGVRVLKPSEVWNPSPRGVRGISPPPLYTGCAASAVSGAPDSSSSPSETFRPMS